MTDVLLYYTTLLLYYCALLLLMTVIESNFFHHSGKTLDNLLYLGTLVNVLLEKFTLFCQSIFTD